MQPGEERKLTFIIGKEMFEVFDERIGEKSVPSGIYQLLLGTSSDNIAAQCEVEVSPVFPVPDRICGWDKAERLLETKEGSEIFEELYRQIKEKASGVFSRIVKENGSREALLQQPIRILHLMIWNEMTDSELLELLEKTNIALYKTYKEKGKTDENN